MRRRVRRRRRWSVGGGAGGGRARAKSVGSGPAALPNGWRRAEQQSHGRLLSPARSGRWGPGRCCFGEIGGATSDRSEGEGLAAVGAPRGEVLVEGAFGGDGQCFGQGAGGGQGRRAERERACAGVFVCAFRRLGERRCFSSLWWLRGRACSSTARLEEGKRRSSGGRWPGAEGPEWRDGELGSEGWRVRCLFVLAGACFLKLGFRGFGQLFFGPNPGRRSRFWPVCATSVGGTGVPEIGPNPDVGSKFGPKPGRCKKQLHLNRGLSPKFWGKHVLDAEGSQRGSAKSLRPPLGSTLWGRSAFFSR